MARHKQEATPIPPRKKTTIESLPAEIIAHIVGLVGADAGSPEADFAALAEAAGADLNMPGFMAMMGGMLGAVGAVAGGPGGVRIVPVGVGVGVAGNGNGAGPAPNAFVFGPAAGPNVIVRDAPDFSDMPPLQAFSDNDEIITDQTGRVSPSAAQPDDPFANMPPLQNIYENEAVSRPDVRVPTSNTTRPAASANDPFADMPALQSFSDNESVTRPVSRAPVSNQNGSSASADPYSDMPPLQNFSDDDTPAAPSSFRPLRGGGAGNGSGNKAGKGKASTSSRGATKTTSSSSSSSARTSTVAAPAPASIDPFSDMPPLEDVSPQKKATAAPAKKAPVTNAARPSAANDPYSDMPPLQSFPDDDAPPAAPASRPIAAPVRAPPPAAVRFTAEADDMPPLEPIDDDVKPKAQAAKVAAAPRAVNKSGFSFKFPQVAAPAPPRTNASATASPTASTARLPPVTRRIAAIPNPAPNRSTPSTTQANPSPPAQQPSASFDDMPSLVDVTDSEASEDDPPEVALPTDPPSPKERTPTTPWAFQDDSVSGSDTESDSEMPVLEEISDAEAGVPPYKAASSKGEKTSTIKNQGSTVASTSGDNTPSVPASTPVPGPVALKMPSSASKGKGMGFKFSFPKVGEKGLGAAGRALVSSYAPLLPPSSGAYSDMPPLEHISDLDSSRKGKGKAVVSEPIPYTPKEGAFSDMPPLEDISSNKSGLKSHGKASAAKLASKTPASSAKDGGFSDMPPLELLSEDSGSAKTKAKVETQLVGKVSATSQKPPVNAGPKPFLVTAKGSFYLPSAFSDMPPLQDVSDGETFSAAKAKAKKKPLAKSSTSTSKPPPPASTNLNSKAPVAAAQLTSNADSSSGAFSDMPPLENCSDGESSLSAERKAKPNNTPLAKVSAALPKLPTPSATKVPTVASKVTASAPAPKPTNGAFSDMPPLLDISDDEPSAPVKSTAKAVNQPAVKAPTRLKNAPNPSSNSAAKASTVTSSTSTSKSNNDAFSDMPPLEDISNEKPPLPKTKVEPVQKASAPPPRPTTPASNSAAKAPTAAGSTSTAKASSGAFSDMPALIDISDDKVPQPKTKVENKPAPKASALPSKVTPPSSSVAKAPTAAKSTPISKPSVGAFSDMPPLEDISDDKAPQPGAKVESKPAAKASTLPPKAATPSSNSIAKAPTPVGSVSTLKPSNGDFSDMPALEDISADKAPKPKAKVESKPAAKAPTLPLKAATPSSSSIPKAPTPAGSASTAKPSDGAFSDMPPLEDISNEGPRPKAQVESKPAPKASASQSKPTSSSSSVANAPTSARSNSSTQASSGAFSDMPPLQDISDDEPSSPAERNIRNASRPAVVLSASSPTPPTPASSFAVSSDFDDMPALEDLSEVIESSSSPSAAIENNDVVNLSFRGIVYGQDGQLQSVTNEEARAMLNAMPTDSEDDERDSRESGRSASDGDDEGESEDEDEDEDDEEDEEWEDTDDDSSSVAEHEDEDDEIEDVERIYPDGLPVSPYLPLLHVNWSFLHAARQKLYREVDLKSAWQAQLFFRSISAPTDAARRIEMDPVDSTESKNLLSGMVRKLVLSSPQKDNLSEGRGGGGQYIGIIQLCTLVQDLSVKIPFAKSLTSQYMTALEGLSRLRTVELCSGTSRNNSLLLTPAVILDLMKQSWPELRELSITRIMTSDTAGDTPSLETIPFPPTAKGLISLRLWDPDMWDSEYDQLMEASRKTLKELFIANPTERLTRSGLANIVLEFGHNLTTLNLSVRPHWHTLAKPATPPPIPPRPKNYRPGMPNASTVKAIKDYPYILDALMLYLPRLTDLTFDGDIASHNVFLYFPLSLKRLVFGHCSGIKASKLITILKRQLNRTKSVKNADGTTSTKSYRTLAAKGLDCVTVNHDDVHWTDDEIVQLEEIASSRHMCLHLSGGNIGNQDAFGGMAGAGMAAGIFGGIPGAGGIFGGPMLGIPGQQGGVRR